MSTSPNPDAAADEPNQVPLGPIVAVAIVFGSIMTVFLLIVSGVQHAERRAVASELESRYSVTIRDIDTLDVPAGDGVEGVYGTDRLLVDGKVTEVTLAYTDGEYRLVDADGEELPNR